MDCRVKPGNDTACDTALCVSNRVPFYALRFIFYVPHFFVHIGSTAGFTT